MKDGSVKLRMPLVPLTTRSRELSTEASPTFLGLTLYLPSLSLKLLPIRLKPRTNTDPPIEWIKLVLPNAETWNSFCNCLLRFLDFLLKALLVNWTLLLTPCILAFEFVSLPLLTFILHLLWACSVL